MFSASGAMLLLSPKHFLILMTKPINGHQPISYSKPMAYLFGGKLDCCRDQNAVTQSILLVDFDHRASVESLGGEKGAAPSISTLMF